MNEITSLQNPRIKAAVRLHASRGRGKQGRYLVFGERECRRALISKVAVDEVYVCPNQISDEGLAFLREHVDDRKLFSVPEEIMGKLEFGDRKEGVVVISKRPTTDLSKLEVADKSLVLVVEAVEKPGNLGAILRSCDGAGVDTVLLANPMTDFFHHNCIRASLGAVFSLQLGAGTTTQVQEFLRQQSYSTFAAMVEATTNYRDCDFRSNRSAIVLGNEAKGLEESWNPSNCHPVNIPMRGIVDSLNVSVSAALMVYEAMAQRS